MAESLVTLSVDLDPEALHPRYLDAPEVAERARCKLTTFEFAALGLMGAVAVLGERSPRLRIKVLSEPPFD